MTLRGKAKQAAATAASVGMATSGLTSCDMVGAVDPPPPPLECNTVNLGQLLTASMTQDNLALHVMITNGAPASWTSAGVTSVTNATVDSVTILEPSLGSVLIALTLDSLGVTGGTIAFQGQLTGFDGTTCDVARTFTYDLVTGVVGLEHRIALPMPARQQPQIEVLGRVGRDVLLRATSQYRSARTTEWSVTGGTVVTDGDRVRWTLPAAPGMYQAEVVMDYGDDGLGFDALNLEVRADD